MAVQGQGSFSANSSLVNLTACRRTGVRIFVTLSTQAMPRTAPRIDLTESDRADLERLARSPHTPQGLATRARIVLAAAEDLSNQAIAEKLHVSEATASKWRRDFKYWGIPGLTDRRRRGRPRKYGQKTEEQLKYWVRYQPPDGKRRWTVRALAAFLDLPASTVHDILARVRLPRSRYLPWRRVRA